MNAEHIELEKVIKKSQFWSNTISMVIALIAALSVGYAFYYNTKGTLGLHTKQIESLQIDVKEVKTKVNESAVYQGVSGEQIKMLEEKVNAINSKMDKMNDKLDQILLKK